MNISRCSLLPSPVWPLSICLDSWTWHSRILCNIVLKSIRLYFHHQLHPQLGIVSALALSLHSFWSYFSTYLQQHIGLLLTWGVHLSVSYFFAFSYCSWGSQDKNTEVVCHSFLQTDRVAPQRKGMKITIHPDMNQNGFPFLSSNFLCHNDWLRCSNPVSLLLPLLLFGSTQRAP